MLKLGALVTYLSRTAIQIIVYSNGTKFDPNTSQMRLSITISNRLHTSAYELYLHINLQDFTRTFC